MVVRSIVRQVRQLQRLAVFEAVGRLGSFTAAAGELGITQPAVSKQVRLLEEQLKLELFDRSANRSQLTELGKVLYASLDKSFGDVEKVLNEMRSGIDLLNVAMRPVVAQSWFIPHLHEIQEVIAPTRLTMTLFDREPELAAIDHDVSIRFGDGRVAHMRTSRLSSEIVVPAASPSYVAAQGLGPDTEPAKLLDCDLLEYDQTGRVWADWRKWFAGHDLEWTPPDDTTLFRAHGSVITEALAGRGVVLTWRQLRRELFDQGLLVQVGPAVTFDDMGHHLVWPASLESDDGFQRLRSWLERFALTAERQTAE